MICESKGIRGGNGTCPLTLAAKKSSLIILMKFAPVLSTSALWHLWAILKRELSVRASVWDTQSDPLTIFVTSSTQESMSDTWQLANVRSNAEAQLWTSLEGKDVHDSGSSPDTCRYDPWEYLPVFWPASPGTCFPRVQPGHRSQFWNYLWPAGNLQTCRT